MVGNKSTTVKGHPVVECVYQVCENPSIGPNVVWGRGEGQKHENDGPAISISLLLMQKKNALKQKLLN
jgi:hypothetical protein